MALPMPVSQLSFTPEQARAMAARLIELADMIDPQTSDKARAN